MSLPRGPTLNPLTLTLTLSLRPHPKPPPPINPILKVNTALQSVLLDTNPKRDDPPTPTFCHDRSILRFSFACGLLPHAKLNPRTPLTPASSCTTLTYGAPYPNQKP